MGRHRRNWNMLGIAGNRLGWQKRDMRMEARCDADGCFSFLMGVFCFLGCSELLRVLYQLRIRVLSDYDCYQLSLRLSSPAS